ncbi:MAG: GyrI-like domain-containing protein [Rhodospirillales bacterium]|nr:GyrI-like domain-containing protein [Rhodospirillales bacterium]MDH3793221.1 GyrI-like domain-containing protein [Rhodospirillales bacterium]MDH3912762.1 GyrI-like domain-containing protein [Rhodospirillales bacterium]MDH3916848.1 GyrI-like domain-containing protein [Rhodospirillales bacterium]MDH3969640.1 GyrI-like domain-containing protein [Rhodospirillales bacterium]
MKKLDLKKELKHLYGTTGKSIVLVDVPKMKFLMIDGQGNPNTAQAYSDAVQALFTLSYTLKFMIKKGANAVDYGVMPLEGLWWTDDLADFNPDDKDIWKWTAMIMQPEWITAELVEEAIRQAVKKKALPALSNARFQVFEEGKAAQCLHVGPYAEEATTIERLHEFIQGQGLTLTGKHHEIYLSDPRRAAPDKLKTIVRQPIGEAALS